MAMEAETAAGGWSPPAPVVDGDQVLHPGDRRSVEIMRDLLDRPTQLLPALPLLTPAARWRSRPRRSRWT